MKIKALLYCTKNKKQKDLLWSNNLKHFFLDGAYNRLIDNLPEYLLNGKIVAECDFEVDRLSNNNIYKDYLLEHNSELWENDILTKSCLTYNELDNYLKGNGYAIHIKNLHIFDKPKELSEFYKIIEVDEADFNENDYKYVPIEKAPQNMMYAYDTKENKYIVISIQSQWMCLILNCIKDVEVRKKVLKEMIN